MTKNVGGADKVARIVAGLVILGLGVAFQSWWGLVGLVPLATAFFGFCPAYTLIGCSSCKSDETPKS
jgi:hypothetical protein